MDMDIDIGIDFLLFWDVKTWFMRAFSATAYQVLSFAIRNRIFRSLRLLLLLCIMYIINVLYC